MNLKWACQGRLMYLLLIIEFVISCQNYSFKNFCQLLCLLRFPVPKDFSDEIIGDNSKCDFIFGYCIVMVTHSSILARKIPWMEEPGGLLHGVTVRHDWVTLLNGKMCQQIEDLHNSEWVFSRQSVHDFTKSCIGLTGPFRGQGKQWGFNVIDDGKFIDTGF